MKSTKGLLIWRYSTFSLRFLSTKWWRSGLFTCMHNFYRWLFEVMYFCSNIMDKVSTFYFFICIHFVLLSDMVSMKSNTEILCVWFDFFYLEADLLYLFLGRKRCPHPSITISVSFNNCVYLCFTKSSEHAAYFLTMWQLAPWIHIITV
jgi:hypothetical protein